MTANEIEQKLMECALEIAKRKRAELTQVVATHSLGDDLGFSSLDLAELVANVEIACEVNPFTKLAISGIRTVADLLAAYVNAH